MTSPATSDAVSHDERPLTVLIGTDTFTPHVNGGARFTERLAAGLVQRGHDVHVMAPSKKHRLHGDFVELVEGQPMMVHRLPSWRWYPHDWLTFVVPWRAKEHARRVLDAVKPDVVHIQSHIVIGRGLAYEAHKRGIPVIATNHVMPENILDFTMLPNAIDNLVVKWAWGDARRTFDLARTVTTPTQRAADFLETTIDLHGVIPISCGINRDDYTADFGPRDRQRLVAVGRLTSEKRLDVTLRAIATLDPALDVHFDIVGSGDQRKNLESQVAELGLSARVTFHGHTSDEQLRSLLTNASVFVIASIAELQSIATMEAMASGLPIVAADAVALPHLVHNGENGYLFTPGDVDDLAAKITTVLHQSPEERLAMQHASLEAVAMHDLNGTLDTFETLYRGQPLPE